MPGHPDDHYVFMGNPAVAGSIQLNQWLQLKDRLTAFAGPARSCVSSPLVLEPVFDAGHLSVTVDYLIMYTVNLYKCHTV